MNGCERALCLRVYLSFVLAELGVIVFKRTFVGFIAGMFLLPPLMGASAVQASDAIPSEFNTFKVHEFQLPEMTCEDMEGILFNDVSACNRYEFGALLYAASLQLTNKTNTQFLNQQVLQ
ncbi:MAG: hypothetical protein AAGA53_04745 [Pseudomonadota bacterium]